LDQLFSNELNLGIGLRPVGTLRIPLINWSCCIAGTRRLKIKGTPEEYKEHADLIPLKKKKKEHAKKSKKETRKSQ
jgi:hypothetical protein